VAVIYKTAVATSDGVEVDGHFGQGTSFYIYEMDQESGSRKLVETRTFTNDGLQCGSHNEPSAHEKASAFSDCKVILAAQIGGKSERLLTLKGIVPLQRRGSVDDALDKISRAFKNRGFS
jgi:nitrogen fixation protein NifB